MISKKAARERMSAAMGPLTPFVVEWFIPGLKEIRACVGFKPKTEQKEAGILRLPPPSEPSAMGISPAATAYAQPEELPPG